MGILVITIMSKDINIEDIHVQQQEVESVKYMSVSEIEELIEKNQMLKSHGLMFNELLKKREKSNK